MSPCDANDHLASHIDLLRRSLWESTGRELVQGDLSPAEAAKRVYEAPFVVASHNASDDPILTYGNRCALELFEMTWEQFTRTPSRLTAEVPEQAERQRLLATVSEKGYIDNYSGIRISRTGRRFRIEQATVWNLLDEEGRYGGQAAMFHKWRFL